MQAGPVGGSTPQYGVRKLPPGDTPSPESSPLQDEPTTSVPEETVTLAARFRTTAESLQTEDAGNGQLRSKMTIALAPQASQEELRKLGVVFPEIEEVRSNQGLSPDGRLELVPVDGTGDPETTFVLQTHEVKKSDLVADPATGRAPIDGMVSMLVPEGTQVLPQGHFGVPDGTVVAPAGYEFKLATSAEGAKTESKRLRLNSLADGLGSFAQSSLAGVITLPYVSSVAPFVALAGAGASLNKHYEALKEAQDLRGYVESREKFSKTDKIELEVGVGASIPVSAEAEKKRLDLKIRTAKSKLASTVLMGAAGGSSIVSYAAAGGAFGGGAVAGALTGALAATPYLAGAAMIVSSGGMVLNSLAELKSLSQEKAELLSLQQQGQTHVLKTIEKVNPQLGRPTAVGEQQVPVEERLKAITKEQRKHRLLATAMSGGMGSIALTVGAGASALALAPLGLAPAGVLAAGQSVAKLRELSQEAKALRELHQQGETSVTRHLERQDGSWGQEKVPISTLLKDIEKKQKTNKMILTAVGSTGAMFGLTLGAGLSFAAAAPILLIPAAIGAAMFPDKVKAFAQKVVGYFDGKFGESARSRKELVAQAQERTAATREALKGELSGLYDSHPELFYVPSKAELKKAKAQGEAPPLGYFTALDQLMDKYAASGSRMGRFQAMQEIETLLGQAPEAAKGAIAGVRSRLAELHFETEAGWVARDVALEMKKDVTDKVLRDGRIRERVSELGFPTDDLTSQYRASLQVEFDDKQQRALLERSRGGDREASLELARKEIFSAGRLYYQSQQELGGALLARLVDAMERPQEEHNLEMVIKEVNHALGRPMSPSTGAERDPKWWLGASTLGSESGFNEPLRLADFQNLHRAVQVLERPLDLASVESAAAPTPLAGPQARMASAFRELVAVDAEAAGQLGRAFATLNDPEAYVGLNPQEAQKKKLAAGTELTQAKGVLSQKAPELLALWDRARIDVEEEYFQNSIDHDFLGQVLARPEVLEAGQRLGLPEEAARALLLGLLRSHVTGDGRALQGQLVAPGSQEVDPAKLELLEILDRGMTAQATAQNQGANDTEPSGVTLGQPERDPKVAEFLAMNPAVEAVLTSEPLTSLARELSLTEDQVRHAYLTLVQAQLHPVLTAEFDGLYAAGDLQTIQTFTVGSKVGELVSAAVRPTAEQVAQQLEALMAGPLAASVLTHPDIVAQGERLQVDNVKLLRTLLHADLAGDIAPLQDLQLRAQQGEPLAQAEQQMLPLLAQAVQQVGAALAAPQSQAA